MKQWIRFAIGAIIIGLVVLLISVVIDSTRPAKANQIKVEERVAELGTAMKGWAMVFGADLKKSGETTREAFLNDIERIKQSQFVQYQKKSFEQAKEQLAKNKTQIAELFEKLKGFIGNVGKNQK